MKYFIDQFDSEVFCSIVGKVFIERKIQLGQFKKLDNFIKRNKIDILAIFTFLYPKLIREIQLKKFRFIGTQCYLELKIKEPRLSNLYKGNVGVALYSEKKLRPLLPFIDIIKDSSRWTKDNSMTPKLVYEYYKKWITNSLNGYVDKIFVKKDKNKVVGLLTFKLTGKKRGRIDLLGVLPDYQDRGIGSALVDYLKSFCVKNNIEKIEVVTELENINALNFYIRNDFSFNRYYLIFHKHFLNES